MVPFWIPIIIPHLMFAVPQKRDHNFDIHPYTFANPQANRSWCLIKSLDASPTVDPGSRVPPNIAHTYMSHRLNSLKGGLYVGLYMGTTLRVIKGHTRSLDYSSLNPKP